MPRKRTPSIESERDALDGPRKPLGVGVLPALMEPRMLGVEILDEDPRNARRHPARNLASIRASLEAHGQHRPLVVQKRGDRYVVRIGNGTLAAAKALGWPALACVVIEEDDQRAMARAIADNRAGELATWDDAELATQLRELGDDLLGPTTGFTEKEIEKLLNGADADRPAVTPLEPRAPAEPRTKRYTALVSIYLTVEDKASFELAVQELAARYHSEDLSQTVLRAVLEARDARI